MKQHGLAIVLAIGVILAAARIFLGCGGQQTLTPADQESITRDGVEIAVCQAEARRCKADAGDRPSQCWGVYDACMLHAGLIDGGSHE